LTNQLHNVQLNTGVPSNPQQSQSGTNLSTSLKNEMQAIVEQGEVTNKKIQASIEQIKQLQQQFHGMGQEEELREALPRADF